MDGSSGSRTGMVDELMQSTQFRIYMKELVSEVIEEKMSQRFERCEGEIHNIKNDIDAIKKVNVVDKKQITNVCQRLLSAERAIDDLQQYSRRNSLRVNGIPETRGENTTELIKTMVKEKLGTVLEDRDIDRSHRVGKPSTGKTRSIIVKFTSYQPRSAVIKNRRKLKGESINIKEDLTQKKQELLVLTSRRPGVISAWSNDGRIFASVPTSTPGKFITIPINSSADWQNIPDEEACRAAERRLTGKGDVGQAQHGMRTRQMTAPTRKLMP